MKKSRDGQYTFVTVGNGIAVLRNGSGLAPKRLYTVSVQGADKGLVLTHDGRYLIAAGGSGAVVLSVTALEQDTQTGLLMGRLSSPHGGGGVGVQISPTGQYVFVTLQKSTGMAVFNLAAALKNGFSSSDYVGYVSLGAGPVGLGVSADGKWLYATSFRTLGNGPAEGTLSVISTSDAEHKRATSARSTVMAGCNPERILVAGNTVWVTARNSNAVLAFSASKLLSDPSHALTADVPVGPEPIGLALLPGGRQLIVANSNQASSSGAAGDLAVVDLTGAPKLVGVIACQGQPRELTVAGQGTVLLVANQNPGGVEATKIPDLP